MFLGGTLAGWMLGRRRKFAWLAFLIATTVATFVYCMLVPKHGEGFADIGYAIIGFLMAAPAGFGLVAGGLIGWLRQVRLRQS